MRRQQHHYLIYENNANALLGSLCTFTLKSKIQQFTKQNKQTRITSTDATNVVFAIGGRMHRDVGSHVYNSCLNFDDDLFVAHNIIIIHANWPEFGVHMASPLYHIECQCEPKAGPWLFGSKIWIHFYAIYLIRYNMSIWWNRLWNVPLASVMETQSYVRCVNICDVRQS